LSIETLVDLTKNNGKIKSTKRRFQRPGHPLVIIPLLRYNCKGDLEMAEPGKRKERNIFSETELEIMLINERIKNHWRSIEKAKKMCGLYGPSGAGGIDYSRPPGNSPQISFEEALRMIRLDSGRIEELKEERAELRRSMNRIRKIYECLSGDEEQIYYMRVIRKMTQEEAAEEMGYSKRHFQRLESSMKDRGLM